MALPMPTIDKRKIGYAIGAAALIDLVDFAVGGDIFAHVIGTGAIAWVLITFSYGAKVAIGQVMEQLSRKDKPE